VDRKILENIILINLMAAERRKMLMETVIGGNTRMARQKDMEHTSRRVAADTLGNGCRMSNTGMEYTDGQMEESIMERGNRIKQMATDITRMLKLQNITEPGKMTQDWEMQF
jgi:hypothetical protein